MHFENRAVAVLDVLGFKKLIEAAERGSDNGKLTALLTVIESHVRWDNDELSRAIPIDICPKYTFISDSLILSVPLEADGYDGLTIVTIKAIQVAHKLLEMGHLVRGGISVGSAWHSLSNIFGSGYIIAYQAEQTATHPCIVLTKPAIEHLAVAVHRGANVKSLGYWLQQDGEYMVDTLFPLLIRGIEQFGRIEDAFQQYKSHIYGTLALAKPGSPERGKWEWMADFFNCALSRHRLKCQPIRDLPFPTGANEWAPL